jgi:signal transduction histidine kinase
LCRASSIGDNSRDGLIPGGIRVNQGDGRKRAPPEAEKETNLLRNALESAEESVDVHVRLRAVNRFLRLEIRDNGRGISPEDQERIFDPFFTTRQIQGGTRLGLSVARSAIESHHGCLRIHSSPEAGTRVTIEIPRCRG